MSSAAAQSLYSREVLRLAMALPHDDRLDAPTHSHTARAPLCGSEMTIELVVKDDCVKAIAIRARACALGQASAAIVRENVIGKRLSEINTMASHVRATLDGTAEMPSQFQSLAYARDYPARHGAILLPFDALLAAVRTAQS